MASKRTDNLNLHAWERTDAFLMDEFNENFDAIDKAVAAKAEQTALDAETAARTALAAQVAAKAEQSALDALTGRVDKKAEQTALDAEANARQTALAALTAQVGELDASRLRFKFDFYTGNGNVGSKNPSRLEFDFKPLMVFIVHSTSSAHGGFPWLRGMLYGHSYLDLSGPNNYMTLTWEDRAIQWYSHYSSAEGRHQLNADGTTYWYLALGVAE